jgi:uncharacterized protein with FMN-binding domain
MRRAALAIVSTVAALVVLLSFKAHSSISIAAPTVVVSTPAATSSAGTGSSSAAGTSASPSSSAATTSASSTSTSAASNSGTQTVTGDAADTRYGPVQVKITVTNGKVTSVEAVEYPQNDPKDQQINAYAVPVLNKEALAAGSATIDSVSGATFTTNGYVTSLQSALDKAGLS